MRKGWNLRIGILLVILGLILNEWLVAKIISPDGVIEWGPNRIIIWSFDGLLILIGIAIIRSQEKNLPKMLLVALLTILICVVALEFILRILPFGVPDFNRARTSYEYKRSTHYHPEWGWSFLPNIDAEWDWSGRERTTIKTSFNSLPIPGYENYGMRDDGLNREAEIIIPVFGDSFTFGATVERDEIWSEIIERQNPNVDMLNLASGGGLTKAVEQYQILRDILPQHSVVIYEMWLGNEFFDNWGFPRGQGHWEEVQKAHESEVRVLRLQTASRLAVVVFKAIGRIQQLRNPELEELEYVEETDQLWDERYGNFYLYPANPILLRYAEPEYEDSRIVEGIENTESAIAKMRTLVGDRELVIIVFPFKSQLYGEIVTPHRPELQLTKPNQIVMNFCQEYQITCFDLLPMLEKYKEHKLFWDYDSHMTPEGQFYAAVEAEAILMQHGVLPAKLAK